MPCFKTVYNSIELITHVPVKTIYFLIFGSSHYMYMCFAILKDQYCSFMMEEIPLEVPYILK